MSSVRNRAFLGAGLMLALSVSLGACSEAQEQSAKNQAAEAGQAAKNAGNAVKNEVDEHAPGLKQSAADAAITGAVKAKLAADSRTRALSINVDTAEGVVTLKGNVATAEEKTTAETLAKGTDGVKSIKNELTVGAAAGTNANGNANANAAVVKNTNAK